MNINKQTRKLSVESLENRRLLAADVFDGVIVDRSEVHAFLAAGEAGGGVLKPGAVFAPTQGGHSILRRGVDSVNYDLHTTGLPPGAYTVWFVTFNTPGGCVDGCNDEDLFFNPDANAAAFWSSGGVVEDDGIGDFHGMVNEGEVHDNPEAVLVPGALTDARGAEIHLVVKYHGPASDDPAVLEAQTHTLLGSCAEGANGIDFGESFGVHCFDPQGAAHYPIELPGDFNDDGLIDAADIDLLSAEVVAAEKDDSFDLNQDGGVDNDDRVFLVDQVVAKSFGDADLDGDVDFVDFLKLADAFGGAGGWEDGDFDGNGTVNFDDFLLLFREFGNKTDRSEVVAFLPAGDVGGGSLQPGQLFAPTDIGHSTLRRGDDSVSYDIQSTGLPPGAYTVWFLTFNNPAACIDGCNEEDLFSPKVNAAMFWASGGVVEEDGVGAFQGQVSEGVVHDDPEQVLIPGALTDPQGAEIHLALKYHGPASDDPAVLHAQTHTVLGGCMEGANAIDYGEPLGVQCFDPQAVPHFA